MNTSNELTENRSEIFNQNEISYQLEFISPHVNVLQEIPNKTFEFLFLAHVKLIFFYLNGKEAYGRNQCKIANKDLILTVLLLFDLIFFKDPQQYNHPVIYEGHLPSV